MQRAAQLRQLLDHIDWLEVVVNDIDDRVVELTVGHADVITRLQDDSRGGRNSACEHARLLDKRTRPGNRLLTEVHVIRAARAATHSHDNYLAAKSSRSRPQMRRPSPDQGSSRRGPQAAHQRLSHHAHPGAVYHEPGADWLTKLDNSERCEARLIAQLHKLGYDVRPHSVGPPTRPATVPQRNSGPQGIHVSARTRPVLSRGG